MSNIRFLGSTDSHEAFRLPVDVTTLFTLEAADFVMVMALPPNLLYQSRTRGLSV